VDYGGVRVLGWGGGGSNGGCGSCRHIPEEVWGKHLSNSEPIMSGHYEAF